MLTRTIRGLKMDEATSVLVTHDDKPVQNVVELKDILKSKLQAKNIQQAGTNGDDEGTGSSESKESPAITPPILKQALIEVFGLASWMLQPLKYLNDEAYESLVRRQRDTYMRSSWDETAISLLPFVCATTQSKYVVFSSRDMVYDDSDDDDDEPVEFRIERQEKQLVAEATEAARLALLLAHVSGLRAETWFVDDEGPYPEWQRELRHGPNGTVVTWCQYDMGPTKPPKIETVPCTQYFEDIITRNLFQLVIVLTDPKNFEYET